MEANTDLLISAFWNEIDWDKVNEYADRLIQEDIYHECPAIWGFWRTLDEDDIGTPLIRDPELENNDKVTEAHIGMQAWVVTDGHHRSFAFRRAYAETRLLVFKWISVEFDKTCFV